MRAVNLGAATYRRASGAHVAAVFPLSVRLRPWFPARFDSSAALPAKTRRMLL